LEELISLTIRIDNRLFERRSERSQPLIRHGNSNTTPAVQPMNSNAGLAPMEVDTVKVIQKKKATFPETQRRQKNGLCFYCGTAGHIAKSCPQNSPSVNHTSVKNSFLLYLPLNIVINGEQTIKTYALLDGGCSSNLMSQSFADEFNLPQSPLKRPLTMTLADGQASCSAINSCSDPLEIHIDSHCETLWHLLLIQLS
jgi:hypothetical protein